MHKLFFKLVITFSLFAVISCNNTDNKKDDQPSTTNNNNEPATLNFTIVNQFPHDTNAWTEGLEFYNHSLYESTGSGNGNDEGKSKLTAFDLSTGHTLKTIPLAKQYYGEGITVMNNKVYQLTWKEKTCFVYDAKTFQKIKEFTYDGEGWGMTNNGKLIIMSNGSSNLYFRDPETFKVLNTVGVTDNNGPVGNINELEYVKGYILANVWETDLILKINPESGKVIGKADFSGTELKYFPDSRVTSPIMNGIAYDSTSHKLYVTGKYWPKIFEVTGLTGE